jgi:competence protein ComGC
MIQMNDEKKPKSQVSIITVIMLALLILSALVLLYVAGISYQNKIANQNEQQVVSKMIK